SYYTNGQRENEGVYARGKENGLWKKWNISGNIIDSSYYDNGTIIINAAFLYFADQHLESFIYNDLRNHKFHRLIYDEKGTIVANDTTSQDEDKVFTKVEIEPSFPGGAQAW